MFESAVEIDNSARWSLEVEPKVVNNVTTDIKITASPGFLYETTDTIFTNLGETMTDDQKRKLNKIFSYGLVRDARNLLSNSYNLKSVDSANWNMHGVTNMLYMFGGCNNLTSIDVSKWDTSTVENMVSVFFDCRSLRNIDVSKWNTSNVTDMNSVFGRCRSLESVDVSKWDTSKVTNMISLFNGCASLTTIDVSKWNVSKVTNMGGMFGGCTKLQYVDISRWDTSNTTNMMNMFEGCSELKTITGVIDMKRCTSYARMFAACTNLTNVKIKNLPTDINTFCSIARINKSQVTIVS